MVTEAQLSRHPLLTIYRTPMITHVKLTRKKDFSKSLKAEDLTGAFNI